MREGEKCHRRREDRLVLSDFEGHHDVAVVRRGHVVECASLELRDIVREQIYHLACVIEAKQEDYVPFVPN